MAEVERLIQEGLDFVTPELLKKLVFHIQKKIEQHYYERDSHIDTK